ncbi:MAG TPA: PRC-barrel domain-containing protein [Bauldia sp.]|nr:PRC-barrel domain-containing protein [Bauldia sp.]
MHKILLTTAVAAVAVVAFVAPVYAQDVVPPPVMPDIQTPNGKLTVPKFVPHPVPGQVMASALVGAAVYNADGGNIGDVKDIVLADDGTPFALVIGVGGDLGIGEKDVAVAFGAISSTVDVNGGLKLTLNATKEELDAAPEFNTAITAPVNEPVPRAPSPAVPVLPISPAPDPTG